MASAQLPIIGTWQVATVMHMDEQRLQQLLEEATVDCYDEYEEFIQSEGDE